MRIRCLLFYTLFSIISELVSENYFVRPYIDSDEVEIVRLLELVFDGWLCCFISCPRKTKLTLKQVATQLPYSRLHPTDQGAILILGIPQGTPSFVKHLTRTLIQHPNVSSFTLFRFQNDIQLPPRLSTNQWWNSTTQLWELPID